MSEWKKVKIGDICKIVKGTTGIASAEPGQYPLVVTAEERKTCSTYQFDCEAVCIPLVSSSGHGKKSLKNVHYQSGKFALGTILCAVIPNNPQELDARYLHQYLKFYKDIILIPLMKGAANVSLSMKDILAVEFPLPPIERQRELSNLFVSLQEKQKELSAEYEKQTDYAKLLRQNILQQAIEGKLTADWRKQNPIQKGNPDYDAESLFEQIQEEKKYLLATKELKKGNLPKAIRSNKDLLKYPDSWKWARIDDLFFVTKLAGFEFTQYFHLTESGDIPVVRAQNVRDLTLNKSNLLYIDSKTSELLERSALTKPSLLVTFIGAGIGDVGIFEEKERWHLAPNVAKLEPLKNCEKLISIKLIALFMLSSFGQKEIFKYMKATAQPSLSMESIRDICFPLPPLEEQKEIITRVEKRLQIITDLDIQITKREHLLKQLMQSILRNAFEEN